MPDRRYVLSTVFGPHELPASSGHINRLKAATRITRRDLDFTSFSAQSGDLEVEQDGFDGPFRRRGIRGCARSGFRPGLGCSLHSLRTTKRGQLCRAARADRRRTPYRTEQPKQSRNGRAESYRTEPARPRRICRAGIRPTAAWRLGRCTAPASQWIMRRSMLATSANSFNRRAAPLAWQSRPPHSRP